MKEDDILFLCLVLLGAICIGLCIWAYRLIERLEDATIERDLYNNASLYWMETAKEYREYITKVHPGGWEAYVYRDKEKVIRIPPEKMELLPPSFDDMDWADILKPDLALE